MIAVEKSNLTIPVDNNYQIIRKNSAQSLTIQAYSTRSSPKHTTPQTGGSSFEDPNGESDLLFV